MSDYVYPYLAASPGYTPVFDAYGSYNIEAAASAAFPGSPAANTVSTSRAGGVNWTVWALLALVGYFVWKRYLRR